jgi:hypothetical protein
MAQPARQKNIIHTIRAIDVVSNALKRPAGDPGAFRVAFDDAFNMMTKKRS